MTSPVDEKKMSTVDDKLPLISYSSGQAQTSTAASARSLTRDDAWTYVQTVKETFKDKNGNYQEFLDTIKDFKAQRCDTWGVISRVKEIFKGHPDLISGFNTFLPEDYRITLQQPHHHQPLVLQNQPPVKLEEAIEFVNKIKARFHGDDRVYKAFIQIVNTYRKEKTPIRDVYQEVSALLKDHTDLLHEFTRFLPNTSDAVSHTAFAGHVDAAERPASRERNDDRNENDWDHDGSFGTIRRSARTTDRLHQGIQDPVEAFCEKVRERLQDRETYKNFLNTFDSYQREFITTAEFQKLMATLVGNHPDLMKECDDLIPYIEKIGFGDGDYPNRNRNNRKDAINNKEESITKAIHELDLSECDSCTPSYRLLPKDYPIPSSSERCEIGSEVLNDRWVCVSSGSEDYSFKHKQKNQYENILLKCEDDRFECDMLLESVNSTIVQLEEILNRINAHTDKIDNPFNTKDHLTVRHLRCIEQIYGEHGVDAIDALMTNGALAGPVIVSRLKQKKEEYLNRRDDLNKVWAEIYAKNYRRSLDHRS